MFEKVFLVPFYAPIISYSLGRAGGIPGGGGRGRMGKIAEALFPNALYQRKIKELCKFHQVVYRI